ncbi:MAG: DUF3775 domain-containing protein [Rhodospirillaceae bacterium]|nr:DUF3775 domain-containing protein [Rhodospirillaceae bacterium]
MSEPRTSGMLTINPETVCYIIIKAREFDVKVDPDDPDSGSNAADDGSVDILEDFVDDPTYQELRAALEALNEDERAELLALTFIGRGDFTSEEWADALAEARDVVDNQFIDYLLGSPMLGDYLEEGFTALGFSCEDVEIGRL